MCFCKLDKKDNKKGFTLIEVLVSLSIFTMVIVIAVGVLLTMVDANSRAQNMQSVMTNLSFAVDSMTRDIRTGTNYFCQSSNSSAGSATVPALSSSLPVSGNDVRNCGNGRSNRFSFSFIEGGGSLTANCGSGRIAYRYNPTDKSIERRLCAGDGQGGDNQPADWQRMTATNVQVDELRFTVTGANLSDELTPTVTIYVSGSVAGTVKTATNFSMQTTVTQQLLDI